MLGVLAIKDDQKYKSKEKLLNSQGTTNSIAWFQKGDDKQDWNREK